MSNQQHHFTYYNVYYYIEQNIESKKCTESILKGQY